MLCKWKNLKISAMLIVIVMMLTMVMPVMAFAENGSTSGPNGQVADIEADNILIVGKYVFDLGAEDSEYNLNNYLMAVQTAYEVGGFYQIYYRAGGRWYDLVKAERLGGGLPEEAIVNAEDVNGDGRYTYWNMVKVGTEEPEITEEMAKAALARKVAGAVGSFGIEEATFGFDGGAKEIIITIWDEDVSIYSLSGLGAMVMLADMEEVRGYTLGGKTRNFYENGGRKDNATLKGWIVEDAILALGLNENTGYKLGALVGKSFTMEVIGLYGGVNFTDEYKFSFRLREAGDAGDYFDELWVAFADTINDQAQKTDPKEKVTAQFNASNRYVNIKILDSHKSQGITSIAFGTGLNTAVGNLLQSGKITQISSAGYTVNTLDQGGNKKDKDTLQGEAIYVALAWLGGNNIDAPMEDYLIGKTVDFILYGGKEGQEVSATYNLYFH